MATLSWTRLKPTKAVWVLLVALTTGGLAAVMAQRYLTERVEQIESRNRGLTTSVLVAKTDLPAGAVLNTQTVAVRPVPQEHVHSAALRPEQFDRIDGQRLQHPLKAGDAVLWSSPAAPPPATFAHHITPGRRAITIPVDDTNGMAGMLAPGDHIDLVLVVDAQGRKHTFNLLQAVPVLATGRRTPTEATPQPGAGAGARAGGEVAPYNTITLDADPAQARNLVLARETGRITALLRPPQDTPNPAPHTPDLSAWLAQLAPPPATPPAPATEVPVLYGGRQNSKGPTTTLPTTWPATTPVAMPSPPPPAEPTR